MNDFEKKLRENWKNSWCLYPMLSNHKRYEWAKKITQMQLSGTHLFTGKKWYSGPTVLR